MVFIRSRMRRRRSFCATTMRSGKAAAAPPPTRRFNRPGVPGLLDAVVASQSSNPSVNAVLVRVRPGHDAEEVAASIQRWQRLTATTRAQMEGILIGKLIATSARQIGMFLVILALVSAAIVAFIIYTLTHGQDPRDRGAQAHRHRTAPSPAMMILQQALGLGPHRLRGRARSRPR